MTVKRLFILIALPILTLYSSCVMSSKNHESEDKPNFITRVLGSCFPIRRSPSSHRYTQLPTYHTQHPEDRQKRYEKYIHNRGR